MRNLGETSGKGPKLLRMCLGVNNRHREILLQSRENLAVQAPPIFSALTLSMECRFSGMFLSVNVDMNTYMEP